MSEVTIQVSFTQLTTDDDFVLDQLTEELADDLRDIGDVQRVERPQRDPDTKGVAELVLGTVTVLAGTDPAYAAALVDLVVGFLNRNTGRSAQLKVGDIEFKIDKPTAREVADLISVVRDAVERYR